MINDLPLPKLSSMDKANLVSLVDRILAAKQQNPDADTTAEEKEIGRQVYALYDLTPTEINIVEESTL